MSELPPPRIFVHLARGASTGVVLRRGPTDRVAVIGWDRRDDSFQVGQWLLGRIYERRCDLSPDGRFFLYFAMPKYANGIAATFSAVSRAPYFRALSLWEKGDAWCGGGWFVDDRHVYLSDCGEPHVAMFEDPAFVWVEDPPFEGPTGGEDTILYVPRLQRDGWALVEEPSNETQSLWRFEKALPSGWRLEKLFGVSARWGGYRDLHTLVSPSGERIDGSDWPWADRDDVQGRLVFAREGKLWAARLDESEEFDPVELHDFAGYEYRRKLPVPYESGDRRIDGS